MIKVHRRLIVINNLIKKEVNFLDIFVGTLFTKYVWKLADENIRM